MCAAWMSQQAAGLMYQILFIFSVDTLARTWDLLGERALRPTFEGMAQSRMLGSMWGP